MSRIEDLYIPFDNVVKAYCIMMDKKITPGNIHDVSAKFSKALRKITGVKNEKKNQDKRCYY